MKTSELAGRALAYAVGVADGCKVEYWHSKSVAVLFPGAPRAVPWNPHTNWAQGGPIIERECIWLRYLTADDPSKQKWEAIGGWFPRNVIREGSTPLIAAMRCYVASKLGDEIEVPEELL